jgi:hypothetical protein
MVDVRCTIVDMAASESGDGVMVVKTKLGGSQSDDASEGL